MGTKVFNLPGFIWVAVLLFLGSWLQTYFTEPWVLPVVGLLFGVAKLLQLYLDNTPPPPTIPPSTRSTGAASHAAPTTQPSRIEDNLVIRFLVG